MSLKKCNKCGKEIDENIEKCPYCGEINMKNKENEKKTLKKVLYVISVIVSIMSFIFFLLLLVELINNSSRTFYPGTIMIQIITVLLALGFSVLLPITVNKWYKNESKEKDFKILWGIFMVATVLFFIF